MKTYEIEAERQVPPFVGEKSIETIEADNELAAFDEWIRVMDRSAAMFEICRISEIYPEDL